MCGVIVIQIIIIIATAERLVNIWLQTKIRGTKAETVYIL